MKFILIIIVCISSPLVLAGNQNTSELNEEAKAKVQMFAKQLKSTLKSAIKQGGFTEGVKACSQLANSIALAHSTDGWVVGRTSLKVRNTANTANEWDRAQLNTFEQQLSKGTTAKELAFSDILTNENGIQSFRFIKAIPTGKLCLQCHGTNLAPDIEKTITEIYPNDKATGYKQGDIRGAFTLTKKLNN